MPHPDPPDAPAALAALAAGCVPGRGPIEIIERRTGLAHDTYRVSRDGHGFSLRVPAAHAGSVESDPGWETRVLAAAAGAGLAPAIRHLDPDGGVLVLDWVEGRTWSESEARLPGQLTRIAALLQRLHALPIPEPRREVSPAQWIERYRVAGAASDESLQRAAEAQLAALDAAPGHPPVLCHSDLHTLNVIDGGKRLTLLDFEYAHVSEPLWDLAGWSANNELDGRARRLLLEAYRAGPPEAAEVRRLDLLAWLYDYVCLLWSRLYLSHGPGAEAGAGVIRERSLRVERRLRTASSGGPGQVAAH